MGHTTRSIPIIQHIYRQGHHITFAGNAWQRAYIQKTFPLIDTIHLDGYNVSYGSDNNLLLTIAQQLPRIIGTIKKEHKWLNTLVKERHFDGIITDNRYGLYHKNVPSVIMTHQPGMRIGCGSIVDYMVRYVHYRHINRFAQCWLVDVPGKNNLSGALSHPTVLPKQAAYIGLLSQLYDGKKTINNPTGKLVVLLSGPEPQRTILSNILWQQLSGSNKEVIFIEGSDVKTRTDTPSHITYHTRLTASDLLPVLQSAGLVICRSGYSTLMDLVALGKKAIVIPTPGQTEQEYLGSYLQKQGTFLCMQQKNFSLQKALTAAENFPFSTLPLQNPFHEFMPVVDKWLLTL